MAAAKKAKVRKVNALVQVKVGDRNEQFHAGDILPDGVAEESLKHLESLGYVDEVDAPESDEK